MDSEFDLSGGGSGSWWDGLTKITGQVLAYRTATDTPRWTPYGVGGPQYAVDASGQLMARGLAAPGSAADGLASLLPLALIAVAAFFVIRALR
jgi:hypothetical protein